MSALNITGHFRDETFQTINYNGNDDQTQPRENTQKN